MKRLNLVIIAILSLVVLAVILNLTGIFEVSEHQQQADDVMPQAPSSKQDLSLFTYPLDKEGDIEEDMSKFLDEMEDRNMQRIQEEWNQRHLEWRLKQLREEANKKWLDPELNRSWDDK